MEIRFLMTQNIFSLGILQNYFVLIPAEKYIKYFSGATRENLMEWQKKILKYYQSRQ